jgi:hypothetical protein
LARMDVIYISFGWLSITFRLGKWVIHGKPGQVLVNG